MKNIVRTFPILFAFAVASAFTLNTSEHGRGSNDRIEVSFNAKMQFNDLVKIKLDLAEAGITIQYRVLKFDDQGGLRALDFKVDCNDGFSGSADNMAITNQTHWGFFRDYRKDVERPFGTGGLE